MKAKKTPLRTCLACGRETDKKDLVRVVRTPDGDVAVDATGKRNGRGAYVCATTECFEKAVRRNRFTSALRVNLREDDVERLRRDFEHTLQQ
ncbi:MAG: RNase P modulator RnpM [Coriobacteriia bacterium]